MITRSQTIYIATTIDTKGQELDYVRKKINQRGASTVTVDLSTLPHHSPIAVDISAVEVAAWHPNGKDAVFCDDRGRAIEAMALAFQRFIGSREDVGGLLGLGGSGGTALITPAMQKLPLGVTKMMVSTMASGNTASYVGSSDITMLHSVVDVAGLNRISRKILTNAAHQITGAVLFFESEEPDKLPALGLTMFGVTTPCVTQVTRALQDNYDCLVFHATGSGGDAMERLVTERLLSGLIDITLTEVADLLLGGVLPCSPARLDVIAGSQLPWIGSCGALDMVNFHSRGQVPPHFQHRLLLEHNAQVTLMRTTPEENTRLGQWIAEKLNRCSTEVRFLIPSGGFSALDAPGQPFWSPESDSAFISALENHLIQTPKRKILKVNHHINSPEFSEAIVATFKEICSR